MTRMAYWYTREYHWQWITFTISFVQYNQFATFKGTYRQHFGDKIEFYCRMEIFCMFFCFSVRFVCGCTLTVLIWVFYLPSMNRLFRIFFEMYDVQFLNTWHNIVGSWRDDFIVSHVWITCQNHDQFTHDQLLICCVFFSRFHQISFVFTNGWVFYWVTLSSIYRMVLVFVIFSFVHFCFFIWNDSESLA